MLPICLFEIFDLITQMAIRDRIKMHMSVAEFSKNCFQDLLVPSDNHLKSTETPWFNEIAGCAKFEISSLNEAFKILKIAIQNNSQRRNYFNNKHEKQEIFERSHFIVEIYLEFFFDREFLYKKKFSKISFVHFSDIENPKLNYGILINLILFRKMLRR